MTLKDKIINIEKNICCKDCKNFELLKEKIPYCKNSDKLILEHQIKIARKCEYFEESVLDE